ncbi:hypothetical protein IW262DRAFT_1527894 [Armillaria fumosa]|nr:hypothetical protein IW262DRAFT_1527894 [Armillaria fumosa]
MSVLAIEILTRIFEDLDRNSGLLHVMQTCKVFYDIGVLPELTRHRASYPAIHRAEGVIYPTDLNSANEDDRRRGCIQVDVWIRILSFTSLHTLCFKACGLPNMQSFSYLLQGCQNLRKLVIDACTFYEEPLDLSEDYGMFPRLPITDLSLLGRIAVHRSTQSDGSNPYPFHHFLTITSLRTLAIGVVTNIGPPQKFNLSSLCKPKTLRLCSPSSFLAKTNAR